MKDTNNKPILTGIVLVITCLLSSYFLESTSSVYSDFPRKEIMDDLNDSRITDLETGQVIQNRSINSTLTAALDIQRVAFFEKLNQLNSTLWIGDNFLRTKDIKNISSVAYGILIDADKDSSTGKEGVDYQ